jgi:hypothetical protein
MYDIWEEYFNDIPRKNFVAAKFGKHAKRQLGCIKYASKNTKVKSLLEKYSEEIDSQDVDSVSIIVLTRYFKDESVPEYVLIATLAHELCHYAHGFHSPLVKKYRYPHKGDVVKKELKNRGLEEITEKSEIWLKENWSEILRKH